jgi:hypothetical protein
LRRRSTDRQGLPREERARPAGSVRGPRRRSFDSHSVETEGWESNPQPAGTCHRRPGPFSPATNLRVRSGTCNRSNDESAAIRERRPGQIGILPGTHSQTRDKEPKTLGGLRGPRREPRQEDTTAPGSSVKFELVSA